MAATRPPILRQAPEQYERQYMDAMMTEIRQYADRLNTVLGALAAAGVNPDITSLNALTSMGGSAPVLLAPGQLKFPATQAPSADVNTLDDYEEGTWTPTFVLSTPGTSAFTYIFQAGTYTKIGRMVFCTGHIQLSAFTLGTGSGNIGVGNFPFVAAAGPTGHAYYAGSVGYSAGWNSVYANVIMIGAGGSNANLYTDQPGGNPLLVVAANMANGVDFYFSLAYPAA